MADVYIPQALIDAYNAGELPPGSPGAMMLESLLEQQRDPYPVSSAPPTVPYGTYPDPFEADAAPRGPAYIEPPSVDPQLYGPIPQALIDAERAGLLPPGSPGARMLEEFRAQIEGRAPVLPPPYGPPALGAGVLPPTGGANFNLPPPGAAAGGGGGGAWGGPGFPTPSLPSLPGVLNAAGGLVGGVVNGLGDLTGLFGGIGGAVRDAVVGTLRETLPSVAQFALGMAQAAGDALDFLADNLADAADFAGAIGAGMFEALDGVFGGLTDVAWGLLARLFAWLGAGARQAFGVLPDHGMSPVL